MPVVGVHTGRGTQGERPSHPGGITEDRQRQGGVCRGHRPQKYGPGH